MLSKNAQEAIVCIVVKAWGGGGKFNPPCVDGPINIYISLAFRIQRTAGKG